MQHWLDERLSIGVISARLGLSPEQTEHYLQQHHLTVHQAVRGQSDIRNELAQAFGTGASIAELAMRYATTPTWIRARLTEAGIAVAPTATPNRKVEPEQVRLLLQRGLTVPEIANRLHCARSTITRVIRRHQLSGPTGTGTSADPAGPQAAPHPTTPPPPLG